MAEYDVGPFIARVINRDGASVLLELYRDTTTTHLSDDDEFVTVVLKVDPFIPTEPADNG